MTVLSILQSLGPIDAKNIRRDALLRWIIVAPLVMALVIRWFMPILLQRVGAILQLDLMTYYESITAYDNHFAHALSGRSGHWLFVVRST